MFILNFSLDKEGTDVKTEFVTTALLGKAKMPREAFENPDGTPIRIDTDYLGNKRSESNPSPGPFENPGNGRAENQGLVILIVYCKLNQIKST